MNAVNPYQSPMVPSSENEERRPEVSYPAHTCPKCSADVTFWMGMKQSTPFRFKCDRCKSQYNVQTPFMGLIFAGTICATSLFVFAVCIGVWKLGIKILLPSVPLWLAAWVAMELLMHSYVKRRGRFVARAVGEPEHATETSIRPDRSLAE